MDDGGWTAVSEIFKNAYLPYRDPETLKAFLKIIDKCSGMTIASASAKQAGVALISTPAPWQYELRHERISLADGFKEQLPSIDTLKGKQDRAILAILLGRELRRRELAGLTVNHVQRREDHWALSTLLGRQATSGPFRFQTGSNKTLMNG